MIIKVPFRKGPFFIEKNVDFIFKIATLEMATEEILKCDFWEVDKQNHFDVNVAILYAAYLVAREKKIAKMNKLSRFLVRKKYELSHAKFWIEHMSKDTQTEFLKAVQDMLGKMTKTKEEKKK